MLRSEMCKRILPGDLSYADSHQTVWVTFSRLVQLLASRRPWMVTQGNHEVEHILLLQRERFTAYNHRFIISIHP
ncbi:hypothetical protein Bca52824_008553 [Brassica carinata]|uniref:Calcineurin-like phosphoesterase domain-containing protein n=1 Tax=Brassica carinata TaxID=52824 RepID=A0A8X8B887_BRACI|nr:hypothetical protein Bca52824_008553 [Brassica carinata]